MVKYCALGSSFSSFQNVPPTNAATVLSKVFRMVHRGMKMTMRMAQRIVRIFHPRTVLRLAFLYAFFSAFFWALISSMILSLFLFLTVQRHCTRCSNTTATLCEIRSFFCEIRFCSYKSKEHSLCRVHKRKKKPSLSKGVFKIQPLLSLPRLYYMGVSRRASRSRSQPVPASRQRDCGR